MITSKTIQEQLHPPVSTYRLQLHAGFTFDQASAITPYLHALGITHAYASPYLRATTGSTHGYDVIDHAAVNPEIGGETGRIAWIVSLRGHGMSHLLDIVPNHMGVATDQNRWWNDILENGRASKYANYFDINFDSPLDASLQGKVLLPILGKTCDECLQEGTIQIARDAASSVLYLKCYERRLPLNPQTVSQHVNRDAAWFNSTAKGRQALHELLEAQHYRLVHWKSHNGKINYRRFFDVSELAALSMERKEVFDDAHALVLAWIKDGSVAGLRIDHPDGLADPEEYFQRLQAAAGDAPLYVLAEKILVGDEPLCSDWPIAGTTGYDFMNRVTGLFVDAANEPAMTATYQEFIGSDQAYSEFTVQNKRKNLDESMTGELTMLSRQLDAIAQGDRESSGFGYPSLYAVLREMVAAFPVYRTFIDSEGHTALDEQQIDQAISTVRRSSRVFDEKLLNFVRSALLGGRPENLSFAIRFQHLTAPVMAKGVEDTTFYQYNRLLSLNEVGSEPSRFGYSVDALHDYFIDRQQNWPYAMSALSTHDTKRSEDVRARISALSEMPEEWRQAVFRWSEFNATYRRSFNGQLVPSRNEEYAIYQTLIGAWPAGEPRKSELAAFQKRMHSNVEKSLREAKVNSSWGEPNHEYERIVQDYVSAILDARQSRNSYADFQNFIKTAATIGRMNSLSQTVLKLTAPGVPDTYQGTEIFDDSLVDPDNRRPVDYQLRQEMLRTLAEPSSYLASLTAEAFSAGLPKLLLHSRLLNLRREHPDLFLRGDYKQIQVVGPCASHMFAFSRNFGKESLMVAVPRLIGRWYRADSHLPDLNASDWRDTHLSLPACDADEYVNQITGATARLESGQELANQLSEFPVMVLAHLVNNDLKS